MRNSRFEVRPTSGALGAELLGIDLSESLDAEDAAEIRQALNEHGVVFFRDQHLSPEEHIAFAERMGTININRFFKNVPGYPQIAEVRKEPAQTTNIGGGWHTDHSYDQIPALGSILLAREVPARGGEQCSRAWPWCTTRCRTALSEHSKVCARFIPAVMSLASRPTKPFQNDKIASSIRSWQRRMPCILSSSAIRNPDAPVFMLMPISRHISGAAPRRRASHFSISFTRTRRDQNSKLVSSGKKALLRSGIIGRRGTMR